VTAAFDLTVEQLGDLLYGEPAFRARQVWQALHGGRRPAAMTDLPLALRDRLETDLAPALTEVARTVADGGQTVKWLWELADGARVETVLMHYRDRSTVCVSSQAGCAMGCQFCATGQAGFTRQLSVGEIVEQVVVARRATAENAAAGNTAAGNTAAGNTAAGNDGKRRLSNVVFMGMGEPLANYDRVWGALRRLHDDLGLSARHLTVSTVGIVPGIRRLAGEALPVNLAVSLHAANDALRDQLVPINRRYPLASIVTACEEYRAAKGRRLSFEWAVIDGVNDRGRDARELAAIARGLAAHVNLIPLNPTEGYAIRGASAARVAAFCEELRSLGVNATVRANRGTDIDAACGQLAARTPAPSPSAPVPVNPPAARRS